jgi:hypothetical protein
VNFSFQFLLLPLHIFLRLTGKCADVPGAAKGILLGAVDLIKEYGEMPNWFWFWVE